MRPSPEIPRITAPDLQAAAALSGGIDLIVEDSKVGDSGVGRIAKPTGLNLVSVDSVGRALDLARTAAPAVAHVEVIVEYSHVLKGRVDGGKGRVNALHGDLCPSPAHRRAPNLTP